MVLSYKSKNFIRIVTASSLFDGHDASINIMRRILQDKGAEVIHLGHNRSVEEVVMTALQEGAQGIAVSSYQGGHMEYFKYMKDLLDQAGASYLKIFGGGGGVIVHQEKKELEAYGIAKIFHPEDGRKLGLEGMIEQVIEACDFNFVEAAVSSDKSLAKKNFLSQDLKNKSSRQKDFISYKNFGLVASLIEEKKEISKDLQKKIFVKKEKSPLILGVTGTGGAGKSSLVDELLSRMLNSFKGIKIGVVCVDPSKRKTGGALLGDRIRMNSLERPGIYMRSLASRGSGNEISQFLAPVLSEFKKMDFDLLIAETSGIGQASHSILEVSDLSLYVMTSEFGAQTQLEKIDMIDYADFISINKSDRKGSQDAYKDVVKQYKRSKKLFDVDEKTLPIHLTQASYFNDEGVNKLFLNICSRLEKEDSSFHLNKEQQQSLRDSKKECIVPVERQNYLAEITATIRKYKKDNLDLAQKAGVLGAIDVLRSQGLSNKDLEKSFEENKKYFSEENFCKLTEFDDRLKSYEKDIFCYEVRGRKIEQKTYTESLSGLKIPRVCTPATKDWEERWKFLSFENFPGEFPYTSGVFHLKREGEDPLRQFAGGGTPARTNERFHFLSKGSPVKRLSTAFDSVTLYGQDPHTRPDIYGKVGESGVNVATLGDMKRLYQGFDLCDPKTSVSMTINGPAPMILAFFMNTAIDQQLEKKSKDLGRALTQEECEQISAETLRTVRGTVQADILKEDQGQNTCIFSIDFALKMMGDIQEYFINNSVKNFYSVSISGYHIAEAGANPITQLAFTLSNAFTYVEYYLGRGLSIDSFAHNFSFFFSNGLDPEYAVIGRVARRIWAVALRELYGANSRSQKLKYHIQTSGRSLHAQEIDFNDIRTTLQALVAINDNCNSLHTNAYDEAITTPTKESVRRAQAIQLIINKEFGQVKNENALQGSYFNTWLTEAVEDAVLDEFLRLNERGGTLGAMETHYQRSKIQEESLYYETLKHDGRFPIIGVNHFVNKKSLEEGFVPEEIQMARAEKSEKEEQLKKVNLYKKEHVDKAELELKKLKEVALSGDNIFKALMSASRVCSLGQMSQALCEVGGQYRRNL